MICHHLLVYSYFSKLVIFPKYEVEVRSGTNRPAVDRAEHREHLGEGRSGPV